MSYLEKLVSGVACDECVGLSRQRCLGLSLQKS